MDLSEQLHGSRERRLAAAVDVDPRPSWAMSLEDYETAEAAHNARVFAAHRNTVDVIGALGGDLPRHADLRYGYTHQGADRVVREAAWVRQALTRRLSTGVQLTGRLPDPERVVDGLSPGSWYVHRVWNEHGSRYLLLAPDDPRRLRESHQRRICVYDPDRNLASARTWWQTVLDLKTALRVPDPPS